MTRKALIKKFYQINKDLYEKAKNPLKCHGPEHHLRVCRNALMLLDETGKRKRIKADEEILIAACLLHDLAAFYPDKIRDNFHAWDAKLATKTLTKNGIDKTKIKAIVGAIASHGPGKNAHSSSEPIEATLLRDADKMDVLGPIGVSRIIMSQTRRGLGLAEIVKKFYTNGEIEGKWQSITLPETKKRCRKDYLYTLDFFKKLDEFLR